MKYVGAIVLAFAFGLLVDAGELPIAADLARPVQILAAGKPLDVEREGHSAPEVGDFDGDGVRDLLVGQYDEGRLRVYRNFGTNEQPRLEGYAWFRAGGEDARVPFDCCIGFVPQWIDLDRDGQTDVLTGSFPGQVYFFRRTETGDFLAGKMLQRRDGQPLNIGHRASTFAVDWDASGTLDLIIGTISGAVHFVPGGLAGGEPLFEEPVRVSAGGEPINLTGGEAAPVAADWDQDGKLDLVVGTGHGNVWWFRNVGKPGAPQLEAGRMLVGESPVGWGGDEKRGPHDWGLRVKPCVVDWNGDGRLDLLLGDRCDSFLAKPSQTESEKEEERQAYDRLPELRKEWLAAFHAYQRLQGGAAEKEQAASREKMARLKDEMAKLQEIQAHFQPGYQSHGFVWLFLAAGGGMIAMRQNVTPARALLAVLVVMALCVSAARGLETNSAPVRAIAFSPDGKLLAAGFGEKETAGGVILWDVADRRTAHTWRSERGVSSVTFSPDGRLIAWSEYDRPPRIADVASRDEVAALGEDCRGTVAFSPDGKLLACGAADKRIHLWDIAARSDRLVLEGARDRIYGRIVFSPDGRSLLTPCGTAGVYVWDLASAEALHVLRHGERVFVRAGIFSRDGQWVMTSGWDGTTRVWDAKTGEERARLTGSSGNAIDCPPLGNLVAIGSDKEIQLFELPLDPLTADVLDQIVGLLKRFEEDSYELREAASAELVKLGFRAEAALKRAAEQATSSEVRIRARLARQAILSKPMRVLAGHEADVMCVAFSPDGKFVASGSDDGTVRVWDTSMWREIAVVAAAEEQTGKGNANRR